MAIPCLKSKTESRTFWVESGILSKHGYCPLMRAIAEGHHNQITAMLQFEPNTHLHKTSKLFASNCAIMEMLSNLYQVYFCQSFLELTRHNLGFKHGVKLAVGIDTQVLYLLFLFGVLTLRPVMYLNLEL